MSKYWQRFGLSAAVTIAVFYVARRGMIGTEAQTYAMKISTAEIIPGVNF